MDEICFEIQDGTQSRVVALNGERLTIGRAPTSGVVLAQSWIAETHARLESIAGAHHVIAVDGDVLVGGVKVADAVLHDGDIVRLPDRTTKGLVTLVYRNPLAPRIAPVHHFATPPGGKLLTIGRADADIVLDQPLVARRHAELAWGDSHHVLRDLGSTNGTWVNGVRVHGSRVLAPGDVVQIGTFRLTYDGDSLDSFDQRGAIRIDARDLRREVPGKVLLDSTTLSIEPCEFVAIVGASGAGKSTLMMALCGFQRATGGQITINGDDLYAGYDAYRSIVGYVPQDDILHRTLSVSRALHHAARLRLPADTAEPEIAARIDNVLAAVDMIEHRDKRIDQLSGGQRKRVSIACELLGDPQLLFLDEPTSGLDPGLERKLMFTLRRLADAGRTVVLITHATQNIRVCDHIVYLVDGKMIYFGPPAQALEFFGVEDFADIYAATDEPEKIEENADTWQAKYRESLQHQKYVVERPARAPAAPSVEQHAEKERRAKSATQSPWRQIQILCRRYAELMLADRKNLALLLLQAPIIGALLLAVTHKTAFVADRIEAKKLVFMLALTGVWFGVINSAREICKEAAVLRRERLAGLSPGAYLASKLVVLTLLVLVQSALLAGVLALGLAMPAHGIVLPALVELYVTIVLCGIAGVALGLALSAIATTPDKAMSLIPLVLVPQVLFAGLMFQLSGVTKAISWLVASRPGVDALSAIVSINDLPSLLPLPFEPEHAHTPAILLGTWGTLAAQSLVFSGLAWLKLRK
ncbi:MAG: ATP-binding cassette domain-containing protein [Kofleriaceae bacterium]|nr:ATP-binding cassette domain-containing protein [Kofleriaceae bacterium]